VTSGVTTITANTTGTVPPSVPVAPSRYLRHVHLLRGIAIMLVVGAHCWPAFNWSPSQNATMLLIFDNVTVVFMFISGLLFQHLSGDFRYPSYLRHRFSIVVLPYLIVSIPAVLMVVFVDHRDAVWPWVYKMPAWEEILFFFATGKHLAPLWFIPMMTLFIICSPLFIWIDRKNLYPVLLPVTLILAVMLGRDSLSGLWNVFGKALFMMPAYLAGMYFSRHRVLCERWCERNKAFLALALALLSLLIFIPVFPAQDFSILQKLVLAVLLLIVTKQAEIPELVERGLAKIADMSFAIYFVHGYLITASRIFWGKLFGATEATGDVPSGIFQPSILGLVLDIVLVLGLSVILTRIGQRVLGKYSRVMIGA
jgi:peptidoglycan/LPS O-acetylase OafA/YrhL